MFVQTGQASAEVRAHLAQCERCREMIADIRANNAFLLDLKTARSPGAAAGAPTAQEVPGYRIIDTISAGGQGVVYRAIQERTQRVVAVKMLTGGWFATPKQRRRFEREIDIASGLSHPNIAAVYDAIEVRTGVHAFAMEYIEGVPIDRWSPKATGLAGVRAKLAVFVKVCDAIHYAHQRGIIHRDLKPSNIMVASGPAGVTRSGVEEGAAVPKVLDFGIAVFAGQETEPRMTQSGEFTGTVEFASPEQAGGDPAAIDFRTDVYSLGVILYAMLTSAMPYRLDGPTLERLNAIRSEAPVRPGSANPLLRGDLDTIILKALEKDRARRYQTVADLGRDISHYLAGEAVEARRDSVLYVLRKRAAKHKGKIAAAAVGAVLIGIASGAWLNERAAAQDRERAAERSRQQERTQAAERLARESRSKVMVAARLIARLLEDSAGPLTTAERRRRAERAQIMRDELLADDLKLSGAARAELSLTLGEVFRGMGMMREAALQVTIAEQFASTQPRNEELRQMIAEARAALPASVTPGVGEDLSPAQLDALAARALEVGEDEQAAQAAARAAQGWREKSDSAAAGASRTVAAVALLRLGRCDEALEAADEGVELAKSAGVKDLRLLASALGARAEAQLCLKRTQEAWESLHAALEHIAGDRPAGAGLAELRMFSAPQAAADPMLAPMASPLAEDVCGGLQAWEAGDRAGVADALTKCAARFAGAQWHSFVIKLLAAAAELREAALPKGDERTVRTLWNLGRAEQALARQAIDHGHAEESPRLRKSALESFQKAYAMSPGSLTGTFGPSQPYADNEPYALHLCTAMVVLERWGDCAKVRAAHIAALRAENADAGLIVSERIQYARDLTMAGDLKGAGAEFEGVEKAIGEMAKTSAAASLGARAKSYRVLLAVAQGRGDAAVKLAREAAREMGAIEGDASAYGPIMQGHLAVALAASGQREEADRVFRRCLPELKARSNCEMFRPVFRAAAEMYEGMGEAAEAGRWRVWLGE